MRIAFYTLGCKVNQYETEILASRFYSLGYDIVPSESEADIYVINSCTVTATGDSKTRKALHHFRREHPEALLVLTGCFPQAFPDAAKQLPEADVITGASNRSRLPEAIREAMETHSRIIDIVPHERSERFEPMKAERFSERTRAFIKIEDGCERYCAYCIIPKARGFIRSKPLAELTDELQQLALNGYKEAVLVGINLSSYGKDLGLRFVDAVEAACQVDGIERIRLGSLEPELLSDNDIERMALLPKLCPQFHLSLQSGCDSTLKRMRRHYDTKEYRRIVDKLRSCFENCAITTDIMVGFPGETEEEFEISLNFAKELAFAKAHVFAYSIRQGTTAATMPGQISRQEKSRRSREMILATERTAFTFMEHQVGKTCEVLFESKNKDHSFEGYSQNYTPVRVSCEELLSGQIRKVLIDSHDGSYCYGHVID